MQQNVACICSLLDPSFIVGGSRSGFGLVPRPSAQCVNHTGDLGTRLVWLVRLTCKPDVLLFKKGKSLVNSVQVVFYWDVISGMM